MQLVSQSAEKRYWKRQRLHSATRRPPHRGRQKATVGAGEETLGREKTYGQVFLPGMLTAVHGIAITTVGLELRSENDQIACAISPDLGMILAGLAHAK
jgi:hypothetical protein